MGRGVLCGGGIQPGRAGIIIRRPPPRKLIYCSSVPRVPLFFLAVLGAALPFPRLKSCKVMKASVDEPSPV
eukprot:6024319-Alexandrium_andersonii.AAC.1